MSKERTQETLGKILGENEERDAIHIAVAPVVASTRLLPGEHIGISEDEDDALRDEDGDPITYHNGIVPCAVSPGSKPVGIVDPYLRAPVEKGQRFWIFIYPNKVTGLRHMWSHPAFRAIVPVDAGLTDCLNCN